MTLRPTTLLLALLGLLAATLPVQAETTAIVNVNVIPMTTDKLIAGQTVIVRGGTIELIDDVGKVAVPEDATIVDGTDRFLMPGLTEMHGHVTSTAAADLERLFSLFLSQGVTSVRGMLGRPSHLVLRDDLAAGRIFGPRLITSGPSMNGNSVSGPADGARQVREQHAAGYDFIKIHPGLNALEFNAIADTANEVGIPFAGHVPVSVGLAGALAKGMATIDHLDGYLVALLPANVDTSGGYGGFFDVMLADQVADENLDEKIAAIVAATREAGVVNVATQSLFEQLVSDEPASALASRADMRYVSPGTVERWIERKQRMQAERGFSAEVAARAIAVRRQLIRALHESGAGLLLGSDAPQVWNVPGFSLHHELRLMVASGLSPYEALKMGTLSAAQFLGLDSGAVEAGRIADLVLLDANPLDDIDNARRVHGVLLGGQWARSADLLARAK